MSNYLSLCALTVNPIKQAWELDCLVSPGQLLKSPIKRPLFGSTVPFLSCDPHVDEHSHPSSLSPIPTHKMKLQSSDGVFFPVALEIAKQSQTIKTMVDDLGIEGESEEEFVPLPAVSSEVLKKVIEWAEQHKDDPPPPPEDDDEAATLTVCSPSS